MCVVQHALILLRPDFLVLCTFRGANVHWERKLMKTENMRWSGLHILCKCCICVPQLVVLEDERQDFKLKVSCIVFSFLNHRPNT